jgi:hypothetical protein
MASRKNILCSLAIFFMVAYVTITIVFLYQYMDYELNNHIVDGHNNGPAVVATNFTACIVIVLFFIPGFITCMLNNNSATECLLGTGGFLWFYATMVPSWVSFGFNCHFPNPCFTITSPLYVLAILHALGFAVIWGGIVVFVRIPECFYYGCQCREMYYALRGIRHIHGSPVAHTYMYSQNTSDINKTTLSNNCHICDNEYDDQDILVLLTSCSHYMHKECYEALKTNNYINNCPVCQLVIV